MPIYAVIAKNQPPWIGYADSPEGACEQARMQGNNPLGPKNIMVVIANDEHFLYDFYDIADLLKSNVKPDNKTIRQFQLSGRFFVDYL